METDRRIPRWALHELLAKALADGHVSKEVMAAELGVSENTVANYETGRTRPQKASVEKWAAVTGFDTDLLIVAWEAGAGATIDLTEVLRNR